MERLPDFKITDSDIERFFDEPMPETLNEIFELVTRVAANEAGRYLRGNYMPATGRQMITIQRCLFPRAEDKDFDDRGFIRYALLDAIEATGVVPDTRRFELWYREAVNIDDGLTLQLRRSENGPVSEADARWLLGKQMPQAGGEVAA